MTPEEQAIIDAIGPLHAVSTPGPWGTILPGGPQGPFWGIWNTEKGWIVATQVGFENEPHNAAFIAAAHQAVPALLARIAELERETKMHRHCEKCDTAMPLNVGRHCAGCVLD